MADFSHEHGAWRYKTFTLQTTETYIFVGKYNKKLSQGFSTAASQQRAPA